MVLTEFKPIAKMLEVSKRIWANPWFASAIEVIFTILVSNLAIAIAVFVYMLGQPVQNEQFQDVFITVVKRNIKSTEIIVFILGLITPAMWIMFKYFRLWKHTFLWVALLVVQAVVVISTAIIFAMSITATLKNIELANFWANWCLLAAIFVWYSTLVYQKTVIDIASSKIEKPREGQESGSDVLAALRGQR